MLVLTRRIDQTILIGDPKSGLPPLEITVIEVRGDQVRLGIKAPRDMPVHRKEIYEQIRAENKAAAGLMRP
jgi:carbon storage regulator